MRLSPKDVKLLRLIGRRAQNRRPPFVLSKRRAVFPGPRAFRECWFLSLGRVDRPDSLAGQVLRQTEFSRSLRTLGWFEPGRLDEDTATLDRLIARYHGFMDLIAADPYLVAIPTMDVELAWQTHMLKRSYLADMKQEVGRLVDHDMAIEESVLARLFAETSDAWIVRLVFHLMLEERA